MISLMSAVDNVLMNKDLVVFVELLETLDIVPILIDSRTTIK